MPLTLIQLVSEQTMQNLLPVLRLKPHRLIHLATPKTQSRSAWIAEAARRSNHPVALETLTLSPMPGMRETMQATLDAIERAGQSGEEALLNFTGGTKLMSIGAYVAALKHKTPSFYVDTQDAQFVDGQSAEGLAAHFGGDLSFTPILRSLTLHAVAAANGCGRITNGQNWQTWHPLAQHLFEHPEQEKACHDAMQNLPTPSRPAEWLAVLNRDLPVPPAVAQLAVQTGCYRAGGAPNILRLPDSTRADLEELAKLDGQNPLPDFRTRFFRAVAPLQLALNFLSGSWWEVLIAGRLHGAGRFRDIRWSAQIGERGGPELEEDVLALDGVRVVYVSCKRSSQNAKLLSQLEQIKARAQRLGGTFNQCFLCIFLAPSGKARENLHKRAAELNIHLIYPEDLQHSDPFAWNA
ncbi:DUF1887 family CARF protein [Fontisphaera persica]|uniref:Card1-like endonuclease domain-containing protein n=1 Tax=Fontisphaera persica TaxID=2974023 RepID=UPI0024C013DD|nr:DUF1887 family CARF protein [Fontisphaera persica]WCJ60667.1 DUF1887 family CARF protein [Fontisphaera persica]